MYIFAHGNKHTFVMHTVKVDQFVFFFIMIHQHTKYVTDLKLLHQQIRTRWLQFLYWCKLLLWTNRWFGECRNVRWTFVRILFLLNSHGCLKILWFYFIFFFFVKKKMKNAITHYSSFFQVIWVLCSSFHYIVAIVPKNRINFELNYKTKTRRDLIPFLFCIVFEVRSFHLKLMPSA